MEVDEFFVGYVSTDELLFFDVVLFAVLFLMLILHTDEFKFELFKFSSMSFMRTK